MNKVLFFLFVYFTSVTAFSMADEKKEISYTQAAETATRSLVTYGGKQFVLFLVMGAFGANPGTGTLLALSAGASYATGCAYDAAFKRCADYLNSNQTIKPVVDGSGIALSEICHGETPKQTYWEMASQTASQIYDCTMNAIMDLPNTVSSAAISGTVSFLCSTLTKTVLNDGATSLVVATFASDIGKQKIHFLFDNNTSKDEIDRWSESIDSFAIPPEMVSAIFHTGSFEIIDEYAASDTDPKVNFSGLNIIEKYIDFEAHKRLTPVEFSEWQG